MKLFLNHHADTTNANYNIGKVDVHGSAQKYNHLSCSSPFHKLSLRTFGDTVWTDTNVYINVWKEKYFSIKKYIPGSVPKYNNFFDKI